MLQLVSPAVPTVRDDEAAEIERFRARQRRLLRNRRSHATPSAKVEDLDEDEGRKRKVSAKWRLKQQTQQLQLQQPDDAHWSASAGSEMLTGFNAFDFSSSPEAFDAEPTRPEDCLSLCDAATEQQKQQKMAVVARQVSSMGFHCASTWEQRLLGLRQPGGPIRQLPAFEQSAPSWSVWMPPTYVTTLEDCRQSLQHQPQQHFA